MNWLDVISQCFDSDKILYSYHARKEMFEEEFGIITDGEVYEAVSRGEVIETYSDDMPYPSVLVFGTTNVKRPLHVVCAYNAEDTQLIIITVYQPSPDKWDNYRRRKK
ncbi:MAG: DUF4258 domain-containing protein [Desulfococcaceae bacterium]